MLPIRSPNPNFQIPNLDNLAQLSNTTTVSANELGSNLKSLFKTWGKLQPSISDSAAQTFFLQLLTNITATSQATKAFRDSAVSLHIAAEESSNNVANAVNNLTAQLSAAQAELDKLKTHITGINTQPTLNPDQQRDLFNQTQQKYLLMQKDFMETQADTYMLNKLQLSLSLVKGLDSNTVSFENIVLKISGLADQTEHDGTQSTGATNGRVAEFFRNRFNTEMTELLDWRGVFS
jgi:hypothetical protein